MRSSLQEREIGPKAGRNHDAVDDKVERLARQGRRYAHAVAVPGDLFGGERREHLQTPIVHRSFCGKPQCTAFRQLVVQSAAKQLVHAVAAQRPEDLG